MHADRAHIKFALLIVGLVAAYAVGLWWPQANKMKRLSAEIALAEQDLGLTRGRTDGLTVLADEVDALRRKIATNNKEIPRHIELASVLRDISMQIESVNLTGRGISTQPLVEKADYVALPVDLSFHGPSTAVFGFVDRVESMPRLMQLESLSIRKHRDKPGEVEADVRLTTYFSPDGSDKQ